MSHHSLTKCFKMRCQDQQDEENDCSCRSTIKSVGMSEKREVRSRTVKLAW